MVFLFFIVDQVLSTERFGCGFHGTARLPSGLLTASKDVICKLAVTWRIDTLVRCLVGLIVDLVRSTETLGQCTSLALLSFGRRTASIFVVQLFVVTRLSGTFVVCLVSSGIVGLVRSAETVGGTGTALQSSVL